MAIFKGERVRELRREKNYSLQELARRGGISASFLSELERGNKRPSLDTIDRLAGALNVSPGELTGEADRTAPRHGERIRHHRCRKGYGLEELASLAGISYSYLRGIERGLVTPSIRCLQKIAAALELPLPGLLAPGSSLGSKLAGIREERGLNRSQLARKSGLSPGMIGQIERDRVQPSLQTVEKIACALDLSPCYFIAAEEGLEELLRLLSPLLRSLLLESRVQSLLRMLCRCTEREFRLVLDFVGLLRGADLGGER